MTYAANMDKYVSARPRAIAIQALVIIQLVMIALTAIGWTIGLVAAGSEVGTGIMGVALLTGQIEQLIFWAAFIVFMTWVHRAISNLPALGSMSCRFTPSGAVWSFFIPLVNLVRGHQVMATIWVESQPALRSEQGYLLPRKTTLVN